MFALSPSRYLHGRPCFHGVKRKFLPSIHPVLSSLSSPSSIPTPMCCLLFTGDIRALCRLTRCSYTIWLTWFCVVDISDLLLSRSPEILFEVNKHVYSKGNKANVLQVHNLSDHNFVWNWIFPSECANLTFVALVGFKKISISLAVLSIHLIADIVCPSGQIRYCSKKVFLMVPGNLSPQCRLPRLLWKQMAFKAFTVVFA